MMEMIIRQADTGDIDSICEIEELCFADPWSPESMGFEIDENPAALYIIAEIEGKVAGYAGMWRIAGEGHVTNVAVRPGFRRMGIASDIIEAIIGYAEDQGIGDFTLEVRESNEAAQALYEKFGFRVEGRRKAYYRDNREDALIMWRRRDARE